MKKGMSGARFIAETLKGYEVSHVFLVMLILKKTLVELEDVGFFVDRDEIGQKNLKLY